MGASVRISNVSPIRHHFLSINKNFGAWKQHEGLHRFWCSPYPTSSASSSYLCALPFVSQTPIFFNSDLLNLLFPPFSVTRGPGIRRSSFRSNSDSGGFAWNLTTESAIHEGLVPDKWGKQRIVTVVLLGWLGAKQKHLRRYVEWYNSRGINAITFAVDVGELLSFDMGRKVEDRIDDLGKELVSWVSEEEDGTERCLIFHTFSNTGWLVYGALLDFFKKREDLIRKIKGCVIDSGGGDPLNPKIWAAGFAAAILRKRSSSIRESEGENALTIETILLPFLESLFTFLLDLPYVNRKLIRIIGNLYENHPPCPQLYLYSSADKVIPFQAVEAWIREQRETEGRKVSSFNFGSSPHVDHYRAFPDSYTFELHIFLEECFGTLKETSFT